MRFVIFGGSGQLGSEWRDLLDGNGLEFSTFDSSDVDITDPDRVRAAVEAERPDVVVNCAAYTHVDRAESEREAAERVNATAVGWMAEICKSRQVRLVHYSTDYVFPGHAEDRDHFPDGYPEDHPTDPVNWYGETKWRGERALQESGVSHLIVRTSWLCGQYGSNFVKTMLLLSEQKKRIDVVDDQWGSPSYAGNVAANTLNLLNRGEEGVFHVTSEGLTTWYRLAQKIFELNSKDVLLNSVSSDRFERAARRPSFSKLSTRKLATVPGSEIRPWREGLERLLDQL